jgi:hypothetical protein
MPVYRVINNLPVGNLDDVLHRQSGSPAPAAMAARATHV